MAPQIDSVDPMDEAAVDALSRYFAELDQRFETGFDPGDTITDDANLFRPPDGVLLLARRDFELVACGAVRRLYPGVAEIKRMWVNPIWRGHGMGRRMLLALEDHAGRLGCDTVRLDTNSALTEAIALYTSSGYRAIERYNDNPFAKRWFEKKLDRSQIRS